MPINYYLKLGSGGDQVLGSSRDARHVGWIKLESFSMQEAPQGQGTSLGPTAKKETDLRLAKLMDQSSAAIFEAARTGRPFSSAVIEIVDTSANVAKARFELKDVRITFERSGPSTGIGMSPVDEFTLNFGNLRINHNPIAEISVGEALNAAAAHTRPIHRGHLKSRSQSGRHASKPH